MAHRSVIIAAVLALAAGCYQPNPSGVNANGTALTVGTIADTNIVARSGTSLAGIQGLTTKGDLLVHTGSAYARLGVGSNDQVLTADSAQANGVKWAAASNGATATSLEYRHSRAKAKALLTSNQFEYTYENFATDLDLWSPTAGNTLLTNVAGGVLEQVSSSANIQIIGVSSPIPSGATAKWYMYCFARAVSDFSGAGNYIQFGTSGNSQGIEFGVRDGGTNWEFTIIGSSTITTAHASDTIDTTAHDFELWQDGTNIVFAVDGVESSFTASDKNTTTANTKLSLLTFGTSHTTRIGECYWAWERNGTL